MDKKSESVDFWTVSKNLNITHISTFEWMLNGLFSRKDPNQFRGGIVDDSGNIIGVYETEEEARKFCKEKQR